MTILSVVYAFMVFFISCELGQRLNVAFDECSELVDQFAWYRFPKEVKRLLPLTLNFTQQPIELKCFGSVACSRETFETVSFNANQPIWNDSQFNVFFQNNSVLLDYQHGLLTFFGSPSILQLNHWIILVQRKEKMNAKNTCDFIAYLLARRMRVGAYYYLYNVHI